MKPNLCPEHFLYRVWILWPAENTKINHYGKIMFRWIYWHILLKGRELPIEAEMTMAGKKRVTI